MIIKLYKSNISAGIILPPIIAIILCLPLLINEQTTIHYSFEWQKNIFNFVNQSNLLNFLFTLFILILNSTTIVKSFNQTTLFSKTTYLPAIIYLIFLSFSPEIQFSPTLVVHYLFILLITQILKLNQTESALHASFKSGLLVGLISCFSFYYSILIITVFIPIIIVHSANIREILIGTLGIIIPLIYLFSSQYIFNDSNIDFGTMPNITTVQYQLLDHIKLLTLILISTLGFKMVNSFYKHNSLLTKKQILILTICSITTVILWLVLFIGYDLIDSIFIIPFIYMVTIGSFSTKNDTFISFLLTITLIINIVALFFK